MHFCSVSHFQLSLLCFTENSALAKSKIRVLRDENLSAIHEVKSIDNEEINPRVDIGTDDIDVGVPAESLDAEMDTKDETETIDETDEFLMRDELSRLSEKDKYSTNQIGHDFEIIVSHTEPDPELKPERADIIRKYSVPVNQSTPKKAPPKRTVSLPSDKWPNVPLLIEENNNADGAKEEMMNKKPIAKTESDPQLKEEMMNKTIATTESDPQLKDVSLNMTSDSEISSLQYPKRAHKHSFYKKMKHRLSLKPESSKIDMPEVKSSDASVMHGESEIELEDTAMDETREDSNGDVTDGNDSHKSFLRRMSLKVQSFIKGSDDDDNTKWKPYLEVLDMRSDNEKKKILVRHMSHEQILMEGTSGMSEFFLA